MKQFDYIVVGQGLAGTLLTYRLEKMGLKVLVIDKFRENTSSKIAPGAYNPMVLKRFTACWKVDEQIQPLYDFIEEFESEFKVKIHEPIKLWRLFKSVHEQNLWLEKSEKKNLQAFMNPNFISNPYSNLSAEFGFGEVNHSGRVYLPLMIKSFREKLEKNSCLLNEDFDFSNFKSNTQVEYKSFSARKIIFCEGHRLTLNPYFNYLPLLRTKGELLTVKIKDLNITEHIKSSVSILPLGNDLYKVGATFNWEDKDEFCTEAAKKDLLERLKKFVSTPVEVVKQEAGLRPTVKDRRPLIGRHPKHENVYVFNGLGTRGLLISPLLSLQFAEYLENNLPLDSEVNINRFQEEYPC